MSVLNLLARWNGLLKTSQIFKTYEILRVDLKSLAVDAGHQNVSTWKTTVSPRKLKVH